MIYTLFAPEFAMLPEQAKEQVQRWLKTHGINPDICAGFTIDYELMGIWCRLYETRNGQAYLDQDYEPVTYEEWHRIGRDEPTPPFLVHMQPGGKMPKLTPGTSQDHKIYPPDQHGRR